ncbi:hypothetical protein DY000_02053550 [Brassica cretica]|uniref:G domain-containing protein n=1 Tax=Brassica cretica TaxID=69181 RepID=A0ABQ7AJC8_BRACR|nr:hypothetical protein DY000_02053550 [Brassica cretica]
MGGDTLKDEELASSLYPDFSRSSSCCFSDDLGVSEEKLAAYMRKREKTYQEILQSHDLLRERLGKNNRKLKLARRQILSYTPGSFADVNLSDYHIPKTTSILIVGPKGAGKSSLVNRITRVVQDEEFAPARAQESYGMPSNGGTFFLQEYMIPRGGSASFCLCDTRGLSQISSSDSTTMIEQWIKKGVHHGEPVIWTSDDSDLKDRLIRDGCTGCEIRKVNSIIFVVNAVEMMESESSYAHMVSTAFNSPLLSFKDDKPAVVITHGDLLSREERARVQVLVGELLGIPPDKQIFDIPGSTDSRDAATTLTVCNLLRHCLEHADKNLRFCPKRNFTISKFADTPFADKIAMFEMSKKLYFPNIKMNDETSDPDNYVAQNMQCMLTTTIQKQFVEAIIAMEKVSIPRCNTSIAISTFKRDMLLDADMYKELIKYQCRTMADVTSRARAEVKWEEDSVYQFKHFQKHES